MKGGTMEEVSEEASWGQAHSSVRQCHQALLSHGRVGGDRTLGPYQL